MFLKQIQYSSFNSTSFKKKETDRRPPAERLTARGGLPIPFGLRPRRWRGRLGRASHLELRRQRGFKLATGHVGGVSGRSGVVYWLSISFYCLYCFTVWIGCFKCFYLFWTCFLLRIMESTYYRSCFMFMFNQILVSGLLSRFLWSEIPWWYWWYDRCLAWIAGTSLRFWVN